MLTAALACCGLQAAANELSIVRGYSPGTGRGGTQVAHARESSTRHREGVRTGDEEGKALQWHEPATQEAPHKGEMQTGMGTRILRYLKEHSPIQPLSNDEYKQRLEASAHRKREPKCQEQEVARRRC